jgi:hypothetical protein
MKKGLKYNFVLLFSIILVLQPLQLYSFESSFQQIDGQYFSQIAQSFNHQEAFGFVRELTKDDYAGRNAGTEGCNKAALWIASQFESWNLHPYEGESYFQAFNSPMTLSKTSNVIGYIPSVDKNCKTSIIIGAHYDHIGKDLSGNIFRGANDNASGTGVLLEFARTLARTILISHINIVLIAFSAEEKGLIGSYYYVNHPLFPIEDTIAMINMDMVGTGIGPWEIATNFEQNKRLNQSLIDALSYYKIYYRLASWYLKPISDHYPFYERGVPVVFFFRSNPTNIGGYHSIKDTIDTIDPKNLGECGKIIILVTLLVSKDQMVILPRYEISAQNQVNSFSYFSSNPSLIFSDCSL